MHSHRVLLNERQTLGKATAWVSNSARAACVACGNSFTCIRRRHHCRRCGDIFCEQCSQKRRELTLFGYTKQAVRVCLDCYGAAVDESELCQNISRLAKGEIFRKYGDFLKTTYRFGLILSGKLRLAYWEPYEVHHTHPSVSKIKGINVSQMSGVFDAGGNTIRVEGYESGAAKRIVFDTDTPQQKAFWLRFLGILSARRRLASDPLFTALLTGEKSRSSPSSSHATERTKLNDDRNRRVYSSERKDQNSRQQNAAAQRREKRRARLAKLGVHSKNNFGRK